MKNERRLMDLSDALVEKGYIRGPFGSALKRSELLSEGIPVYEQQHAINNTRDFRFYISNEKFQSMRRFQVQENDLIISCSGTIGCVSIIGADDPKGIISQALLILRANSDVVLPEYLKYFFISKEGHNAIVSRSIGSVQINIAKRDVIEQIKLNLPSIYIQEKVVSILKSLDDKIALNNRINANLEQQILAIYKNMFEENKNKDRKICRIEECFEIGIGKTPPRKEPQWFSDNISDIKWVSISDMGGCGLYISDSSEYLTEEAVEKFNIKIIPDNTILLSFKLTVGRVAITNGYMTTNEAIAHFKTSNKKICEYLYCYLKTFNYQNLGSTSSIATAVNSKIIKGMPFVVPTEIEYTAFHNTTSSMFAKIKANQLENEKLIKIRDTLLPQLLNGKIDVSEVEV